MNQVDKIIKSFTKTVSALQAAEAKHLAERDRQAQIAENAEARVGEELRQSKRASKLAENINKLLEV